MTSLLFCFFCLQSCSSHTLWLWAMKEESSSSEKRVAAVTVTDTVLARCFPSRHCPLVTPNTVPSTGTHTVLCVCVWDLILSTMEVSRAEEVIKVSTRTPDTKNLLCFQPGNAIYTGKYRHPHRLQSFDTRLEENTTTTTTKHFCYSFSHNKICLLFCILKWTKKTRHLS